MNHKYKDHNLILHSSHCGRIRYHCINCNLYFSFGDYPDNHDSYLYISTYQNMFNCKSLTNSFINLTCEEIQIKNILE